MNEETGSDADIRAVAESVYFGAIWSGVSSEEASRQADDAVSDYISQREQDSFNE